MQIRMPYWDIAPGALAAMRGVNTYLNGTGLGVVLLELVFLRVSQMNGCGYCVWHHAKALRDAGETDERLDGVAGWRESPAFTERERAALAWAEALARVAETHAPDAVYEGLKPHFSEKEIVDLTFAIAQINAWNRIAIGFRQPARAKPAPKA